MISLSTAKFLLFIALCLGPKFGGSNHTIEIVSKNAYVVWTQGADGWAVSSKSFASDDWPDATSVSNADLKQFSKTYAPMVSSISNHNWNYGHASSVYFENGDVVEKEGTNKVFYTINAGSYNQQIFTIQTVGDGKS